MAKRAAYTVGEYELGRLGTPCGEFPRGQYCAVWREPSGKRRRHRLKVGLERPQSEAEGALNLFVRQRESIQLADAGCTINSLFELYIKDRRREGKQASVMEHNWRAMRQTFGHLQPADLEKIVVVDGEERTLAHQYAFERHAKGIKRATIWTELTRLRTALQWAAKRGHIAKAPYVWAPSKGEARDPQLTVEEVWAFLDACKMPHVRMSLLLGASTTARKGAILDLQWPRVDFERRLIDFRTDAERSILDTSHKKKRAIVPMNNLLYEALLEAKRVARTSYVIEWNGHKVGDPKKAIQRAAKAAGLGGRFIGLHALRHAGATWLAEDDVDMRHIQRFLGHEELDTTETTYAKASAAKLSGVADVIELRLRRKKAVGE
jgi:integrase